MSSHLRVTLAVIIGCLALLVSGCQVVRALSLASTPVTDNTTIYVVKAGDTFSGIARQFNVSVEELIGLNIDRYPTLARDPSLLQVGWQLRVPNPALSPRARVTLMADATKARVSLVETARLIVEGINLARGGRSNIELLRLEPTLTQIATDRSADMIARDYFDHKDPRTGQDPLLRYLQAARYEYRHAGENIAEIKNDADWVPSLMTVSARYRPEELSKEFVQGWLASPEHRLNIFNARYRRTGVGLVASADGRRIVATQVFSD